MVKPPKQDQKLPRIENSEDISKMMEEDFISTKMKLRNSTIIENLTQTKNTLVTHHNGSRRKTEISFLVYRLTTIIGEYFCRTCCELEKCYKASSLFSAL